MNIDFHTLIGFLGHLQYLLLLLALLMRDMMNLRLLAIFSSFCALIYYSLYAGTPLWINIGWEVAFTTVNVVQAYLLFLERRGIQFSEEEKSIYDNYFSHLSPVQFKKVIKIATTQIFEAHSKLIDQGAIVSELILICSGEVQISVDDNPVAVCSAGNFIGEFSFLSGEPASATATTTMPTRCLIWQHKDLEKLNLDNSDMRIAMSKVFSQDLIRKLTTYTKDKEK